MTIMNTRENFIPSLTNYSKPGKKIAAAQWHRSTDVASETNRHLERCKAQHLPVFPRGAGTRTWTALTKITHVKRWGA
ncbi:uncharacterized protein LOC143900780 isoform X2 [Temnothorax americanus]|uniref:uncharacterized protein LOC143900780 isoform X2 n=1 Tax=Temnothorax americanus TaxID=1964332 RepID=UPI00406773D8